MTRRTNVREYIGARYIPVFADPIQWDDTLIYEPLTVVMNEGASYVSRKSVPAGIQLDNTDYWILWADYNAQLQHYIDIVNTFDNRIQTVEEDLPISAFDDEHTVDARFDVIENSLNTIKADSWVTTSRIADSAVTTDKIADNSITTAKFANGAIKYDMLTTGDMVVIGDSYSYTSYTTAAQAWWTLVANILNVTPHNYAANGTAFVKTTPSPNFYAQLELANADTSFDNDNVKYVFIYGGYNDCYDAADIGGGDIWTSVRDCLIYAKEHFANALIVIAGCNTNKNLYVHDSTHYNQMIYSQIMANAINTQYGAIFLDLTQLFVGEYDLIDNSTDHPNVDGQKAIAQAMLNGVFGNNPYTNMVSILDVTANITSGSATSFWVVKVKGEWGMYGVGIRAGSNGMFTVQIPHNIWVAMPDNVPCCMDSANGQVTYGAMLSGSPGTFNCFANQNANCFISWNVNEKRDYMNRGASHKYTLT